MILLDTHVWIWWINEPTKLDPATVAYLDNLPPATVHISVISCWEVAKLVEKNRLTLPVTLTDWFELAIDRTGVTTISLEREIIVDACNLPGTFHADPADQLIVSTSRIKQLPLVTADGKILSYEYVNARHP